jgi:hypothetical protein
MRAECTPSSFQGNCSSVDGLRITTGLHRINQMDATWIPFFGVALQKFLELLPGNPFLGLGIA